MDQDIGGVVYSDHVGFGYSRIVNRLIDGILLKGMALNRAIKRKNDEITIKQLRRELY